MSSSCCLYNKRLRNIDGATSNTSWELYYSPRLERFGLRQFPYAYTDNFCIIFAPGVATYLYCEKDDRTIAIIVSSGGH